MVGPKVQDLIQRDIDGLLNGKESAALAAELKKSPAARRLKKELEGAVSSVVALRAFEVPPHLGNRIKSSLRAAFPGDFAPPPARPERRSRFWIRTSSVFAAGFALGLLALFVVVRPEGGGGVSPAGVSGSMVPQQQVVPIRFGATEGTVTLTQRESGSEFVVRVNVPEGVVLRVEYNAALLNVTGVHGPSGRGGVLTVRDGRVESVGKGVQEFGMTVAPKGAGAALSVSIISRDRELYRKAIPIGA
jgi:hypothetical protein